ncbi:MAG: hypothetical protein ACREF6_02770 [Alphaproteobacteria bacterium]
MTRKVSVDSVGDASADDLLRFLYDLAFRQRSLWGWGVASAFAAIPGWLSLVSMIEGNAVSGAVFAAMCGLILGLRIYLLRKIGIYVFDLRKAAREKRNAR